MNAPVSISSEILPVTVVIPIKNEAANLPTCLNCLQRFTHVLVVDSGSTDESSRIAQEMGAQVLQFTWNGRFPKKRNWVLENFAFQTPWVLFLDADEQVTPEFTEELANILSHTSCNGFWIRYQNHFMGQLLRYGDPFRKLSLIRVGCGAYERIDEDSWSTLDMEVHEHLIVDGEVGEIRASLIHNDFKGLQAYYDRHNQYSSWEAARYLQKQNASQTQWTARQRWKYRLMESALLPLSYFFVSYFLKGGFLDGRAGWRFAVSKAFYFYQINFKIAELRHQRNLPQPVRNLTADENL